MTWVTEGVAVVIPPPHSQYLMMMMMTMGPTVTSLPLRVPASGSLGTLTIPCVHPVKIFQLVSSTIFTEKIAAVFLTLAIYPAFSSASYEVVGLGPSSTSVAPQDSWQTYL